MCLKKMPTSEIVVDLYMRKKCFEKKKPIFIILKKRNICFAINMIYYILLEYNKSLYYPQFNRFKDDDLLKLLIIHEISSKKIMLGFNTRKRM